MGGGAGITKESSFAASAAALLLVLIIETKETEGRVSGVLFGCIDLGCFSDTAVAVPSRPLSRRLSEVLCGDIIGELLDAVRSRGGERWMEKG